MEMKNFFIVALVLVAFACMAFAQDQSTTPSSNQNCPVQRTRQLMSQMMDRMKQMQSQARSRAQAAVPSRDQPLTRRRRQALTEGSQPAALAPIEPVAPQQPTNAEPIIQPVPVPVLVPVEQQVLPVEQTAQPSAQELIKYQNNIRTKENQLTMMLSSMMNNKYMPNRDQIIQLLTTVVTLLMMLWLGPVMGNNAGLIQSIVKQVVPFIVSYGVHYAADQAMPVQQIEAPITQVQLQPVAVPHSQLTQTI